MFFLLFRFQLKFFYLKVVSRLKIEILCCQCRYCVLKSRNFAVANWNCLEILHLKFLILLNFAFWNFLEVLHLKFLISSYFVLSLNAKFHILNSKVLYLKIDTFKSASNWKFCFKKSKFCIIIQNFLRTIS